MDGSFDRRSPFPRWVVFLCGAVCIAAVGVSSRFYQLHRNEKQQRLAAQGRLRGLSQQLRLLEEKNRELVEELREAKKVADDLAREREALAGGPPGISPESLPSPGQPPLAQDSPLVPGRPSRLANALRSFSAERLFSPVGRAQTAAAKEWKRFRTTLVASVSQARPPDERGSVVTPTRLLRAVRGLPLTRLANAASEVKRAARDVFVSARNQFALNVKAARRPETREVSSPPETSTKLTATNEELREELEEVRQEKRELERQIAERTGKIPGSVDVGEVKVTTGRRFNGRVLVVNQKHNFVVIDVGKIHGLEKGVVLIVHRGNRFIGKAQVVKVYEKMAAADLVADWMQEDVQVSDGVKKF